MSPWNSNPTMSRAKRWVNHIFLLGLFAICLPSHLEAQADLTLSQKIAAMIRFPTVSHADSNKTDWQSFADLHSMMRRSFPRVHAHMELQIIGGHSLLYKWEGSDSSKPPVMYYAHQDVVPVETEDGTGWTHPPFSGDIADGYIWGRGALDTKSLIVCLMEAAERLLAAGFEPQGTIYLAFGHDEEVGGNQGAAKIADHLEAQGVHLGWVLDEGLSLILGAFSETDPPVALVGLAEKGHANIELKVLGDGGHSAAPPLETVIGTLAIALDRLQKNPMEEHLLPLVIQSLINAAPLMDKKTQMAMSNVGLFRRLILKALAKDSRTDAIIRTKISPTIITGGVKNNVLPKEAKVNLNVRTMPGDSIAHVMAHIHEMIDDPRVLVTLLPDATEASPVTSHTGPEFACIKSAILGVYPNAIVSPALMPAGTDSKHFLNLSKNLFRFSPFCIHKDEASRIHNTDERISVQACDDVLAFYMLMFHIQIPKDTGRESNGNGAKRQH
jgi:carboxypeptidase PM20D1